MCYSTLRSVIVALTIVIVLGHHELYPNKMANLSDKCYVCSDCTTDLLSPVCFSFFELLYALRYNDNEMASECSHKRKNCRFLTLFFLPFIFISWRLITLQYCSDFCHTLTWISHRFTCIPRPDPPSRLPPYPISLGLPSEPALSTCLMHPTWAGDLFHP